MRAFYTTADKSCELKSDNFLMEERQHKWVETNLQLLFPDLELIESKPRITSKIPDTVAYDYSANTFVAIEYKNRRSDTVREQAEDYLIKMRNNPGELASRYNDRPNVKHKTSDSFDWRKMYVVIIAPEFTKRQMGAANHRDTECLYELKRFENGFITLRFVGGKHAPIDIAEQPKGTAEDTVREPKRPNTGHERPETPVTITREQPTGQQNIVGTPLAAIQYQNGMKCVGYLIRNGERKTKLNSWINLLVAVMNEVNPQQPIKRGTRWLVNHTPQHDNGKKFQMARQLDNGMWLEASSKAPPYILKICNSFPVTKELGLELH